MNRSDLLSLGDPIPTSLGKALTPEQLAEKKAAAQAALQQADYSKIETRALTAMMGDDLKFEDITTTLGEYAHGLRRGKTDLAAAFMHYGITRAMPKFKRFRPMVEDPPAWAVEKAAQAWCDPSTSDRTMDVELATVFARMLAEAVQEAHNLAMRPMIMVNPAQFGPEAMDDLIRKANRGTLLREQEASIADTPAAPVALHE